MRIIGIDPSLTNTAVCVYLNGEHQIHELSSAPCDGSAKARIARFVDLADRVCVHVPPVNSVVFIEGYSFASKFSQPHTLGEYGGILRYMLLKRCGVIDVPPSSLKMFTTGKGNAKKEDMAAHVAKRWGHIFATNDACDAYCLARFGACYTGLQSPETQWQREAIETLKMGKPAKKKRSRNNA